MKVLPNGHFAVNLDSETLLKGLRTHSNQPRNKPGLETLKGVMGKDGTLQRIFASDFTRITGANIDTGNHPFPQIYRLNKHFIICNVASIVEYDGNTWNTKISGLTPSAYPWYVASSYDWIYLTNGTVAVIRNPETNTYALSTSAPVGLGVCNFNGQIIVGDQEYSD